MLFAAVADMQAQDTIDTNYYRYDNHFLRSGSQGVVNLETGEYTDGCPNGVGFALMARWNLSEHVQYLDQNGYWGTYRDDRFCPYMRYRLSEPKTPVYGIAIPLDSIENFTEGDSMTVTLCDIASDSTHFIPLDSITIKGGEIGKRRWMEIPILRNDLDFTHWEGFEPYDNCIDTVLYRQVLEFYFDEPKEVSGALLWWKARVVAANGSGFILTECTGYNMCFVAYYDEHCVGGNMRNMWDPFFPIITPLPEWEEPSMTQVIPFPAATPEPPDPEDPDPENPGGDEGIGEAVGSQQSAVSIYPNPASGYAVVTCDAPILELTLCDINGRLLLSLHNCGDSAKVDTSPLAPGLYMLHVSTDAGTVTRKLAVK